MLLRHAAGSLLPPQTGGMPPGPCHPLCRSMPGPLEVYNIAPIKSYQFVPDVW